MEETILCRFLEAYKQLKLNGTPEPILKTLRESMVLIDKGYSIYEEIEPLVRVHGSIESVPDIHAHIYMAKVQDFAGNWYWIESGEMLHEFNEHVRELEKIRLHEDTDRFELFRGEFWAYRCPDDVNTIPPAFREGKKGSRVGKMFKEIDKQKLDGKSI